MLRIASLIAAYAADPLARRPVLAFLGDSVTEGCFESDPVTLGATVDGEAVYHNRLRAMIAARWNGVDVAIVNAGEGGDTAGKGLDRIGRGVLDRHPDFCCVCFGLNDVSLGRRGLARYPESLRRIFALLTESGIETVFMTPNMLATRVLPELKGVLRVYTGRMVRVQTQGLMDEAMAAARQAAAEAGVPVCDVYRLWKEMAAGGEDVTLKLANGVNHPTREMHQLFADALYRMMFAE